MAIQTDKLSPRILINENEIFDPIYEPKKPPITLIFGFAPIGRTCEMVVCNETIDILREFGSPESVPEKYFINAGVRMVENGATVLMTRLPYDNDQSHKVKYIDYKIEDPISYYTMTTVPQETALRTIDDNSVTVLKEMHALDPRMTQSQRISQIYDESGVLIHSMTAEELVELDLDPTANLEENTFRIVDIRDEQYGVGVGNIEYVGIFPIITTAPMAMYYQNRLENSTSMDQEFKLIDTSEGIEMSTDWFRNSDPLDDRFKEAQAQIIVNIPQELNFNTSQNKFRRGESFQDMCVKGFPQINMLELNKIEQVHLKDIGVLVCEIIWDFDTQKTKLVILESFVGKLGRANGSIDRVINANSRYIRMYKNFACPPETDYFLINDQKIASLGMQASECYKYINYKTSILDPITYMLESVYNDVDSLQIDTILDAGISSTAFAAYVAKNADGESFFENDKVRTTINWTTKQYYPEEQIQDYAKVWNEITRLFGDFIKNVRGDCVYIADGPRIFNLERNYPIRNYTDMENTEMFTKFLPYFNGYSNNYVARYWNWVYIADIQYQQYGLWVPPSVVMGSQLAYNDQMGHVWYAPAGQTRGLVSEAYDVSVRTKPYNQENDLLYQNHWNFFQIYQNEGVVVEGQKTMQTKKTSLDRLNVRRMVCWIKQQVRIIANRYKYEPNTRTTREGFVSDVRALLREVQKGDGISDFQVVSDERNEQAEVIDRHEFYMKIAIKPIKAIEYIIIDLNILNGNVLLDDSSSALLK